ncbi:MAG: DUF2116 family Zn-ribbon domain-containing protein [Candidatus Diapherotrites archaeon]|nr:DUF2116 family Zn-ribbon domain-containing protein [Candidatus Diapherotrites archaeon]
MRLFDNIDSKYFAKNIKIKRKCLNCGKELETREKGDLYSRRFCSDKCRDEYMNASSEF